MCTCLSRYCAKKLKKGSGISQLPDTAVHIVLDETQLHLNNKILLQCDDEMDL